MKFKFEPDDFFGGEQSQREKAEDAQAALDKHLESLPKIYRSADATGFNDEPGRYDTHTAVLMNLEPIALILETQNG